LLIPIDYKIYFRFSAGTRLTILGDDLVWVPGFGDWVIIERFGGPVRDHGGDSGVTCSGLKYRLPSSTSSVVEEDEVIVDNKSFILPSNIATPLIWDMDGGFEAMKGP
jgi:hypothetical protein